MTDLHVEAVAGQRGTFGFSSARRYPAVLAMSLLGLLAPSLAMADEDTTIMPGSACKLAGYQGYDTVTQSTGGVFANAGTEVLLATCPMARAVQHSTSLEFASVLVSNGVSCDLFVVSAAGDMTRVQSTSTSSVGDKTRLEWALGDANVETPEESSLAFQCGVPSSGTIYNYRIDENDDED
jgi:hypothetical protein